MMPLVQVVASPNTLTCGDLGAQVCPTLWTHQALETALPCQAPLPLLVDSLVDGTAMNDL